MTLTMNASRPDYSAIIEPNAMKANAYHDHRGRFASGSSNDHVNVHDREHLAMAAQESFGSRVMDFSNGEGNDLDKNVRFATNTNASGAFERGALRVEIFDPSTQKRNVYQRRMSELPRLVGKVLEKKYAPVSQHRRQTAYVMKAGGGNPNHDAEGKFASSPGGAARASSNAPEPKAFKGRKIVDSFVTKDGTQSFSLQAPDKQPEAGWAIYQHGKYASGSSKGKRIDSLVARNTRHDGETDIRNQFEERKKYHIATGMKADGHWVTLPTGARIQIHGNVGGAQAQPAQSQAKPQTQSRTVESEDSNGNAGEGLTHAQRQTIVNKITERMGIDKDSIEVAKEDREDENGKVAGDYDPATKKITVYPEGFSKGKDELIGTLVHEEQHMKLDKVLNAYNEQQKQYQAGESLTSGKLDIYKELKPVFSPENRITYERADGVNNYSTMFWQRYQKNPSTQTYVAAINETLAETARLTQSGQGGDISPQMMSLYNKVNRFAAGLK